jgi:hypothetical protein
VRPPKFITVVLYLEACRQPSRRTRLRKLYCPHTRHFSASVQLQKRYHCSSALTHCPQSDKNVKVTVPIPPQGPVIVSLSVALFSCTNSARFPPKATPPSLPIHAARNPLRWQHLHPPHHIAATNFPQYERFEKSPFMAAEHGQLEECGGG